MKFWIGFFVAIIIGQIINLILSLIIDRDSYPIKYDDLSFNINTCVLHLLMFIIVKPISFIINKIKKEKQHD